jgi:hypothetical protein
MTIDRAKSRIRQHFPGLVQNWWRVRNKLEFSVKKPEQIFTKFYLGNLWGDSESLSGPGSRLDKTDKVRAALPALIKELDCHSLLDIPCGDFYWMKEVNLDIPYIGADIVPELVQDNQSKYGHEKRNFIQLDLRLDPLPKVDLVLCRDCLVHLSYHHIDQVLENIKSSGSRYLLMTTFMERKSNTNIVTGEWRAINFERAPFRFPPPLRLIDDSYPLPNYYDKYLGLWEIATLQAP